MHLIHFCLRVLLYDKTSQAIAWALLPGYALGVFPPTSLQWFLALFSIALFRVNVLTTILSALFFFILSHWADGFAGTLGNYLLTQNGLFMKIWPRLYHAPIVPFTLFNQTVVMGYLILTVAMIPLCLSATSFLDSYSSALVRWAYSTDFWQSFIASRFYRRFSQYLRYEIK